MSKLSKKNERKHRIKAIIYTSIAVGLLSALFVFSDQLANTKEQLKQLFTPEQTKAAPEKTKVAVAMLT